MIIAFFADGSFWVLHIAIACLLCCCLFLSDPEILTTLAFRPKKLLNEHEFL